MNLKKKIGHNIKKKALRRLKVKCEKVKIDLSQLT